MIKLYGFKECGPCQQIKHLLEKFGIEFEYIDILKKKVNIDVTHVPVLELDNGAQFRGLGKDVVNYIRELGREYKHKAKQEIKIKLKGINFFKTGTKGTTIREKDGLVLIGEMIDGRPATMCIPWDTVIEVKSVFPWVTVPKI